MSIDRRRLVRALAKKSFELDTERDHDFYFLKIDGYNTDVFTKVSRGKKYETIGKPLVGDIARQLRLSRDELGALVDCTLSKQKYVEKMIVEGHATVAG